MPGVHIPGRLSLQQGADKYAFRQLRSHGTASHSCFTAAMQALGDSHPGLSADACHSPPHSMQAP